MTYWNMMTSSKMSRYLDHYFSIFWKLLCSTTLMQSFIVRAWLVQDFLLPPGYLMSKKAVWLELKSISSMWHKELLSHFRVYRKSATSAQTDGRIVTDRSSYTLVKTAPLNKKYATANNSPFTNQTILKAIMKQTKLWNNFWNIYLKQIKDLL